MATLAKIANEGLELGGQVAVVAGGTSGIGEAIAKRLAKAGASVIIVGRDEERGYRVVKSMRRESGVEEGKTFGFLRADLTLMSEVKAVVEDIASITPVVDYLFLTQGAPPNGSFELTSEGHEQHFARGVLSRFTLAHLLAKRGILQEGVLTVESPGAGGDSLLEMDDLELLRAYDERRYGMAVVARRDSAVLDAITSHFPIVYPHLRSYHLWPGFVHSGAFAKAFPFSLGPIITLAGPLLAVTVGHSPASYANIPIYVLCNPLARGELQRRRGSVDSTASSEPESELDSVASGEMEMEMEVDDTPDLSTSEDFVDASEQVDESDHEEATVLRILGDEDLEEGEEPEEEWWRTLQFSNEKLRKVRPTRWVVEDDGSTRRVWDLLVGMVGE
ncbi:hypothetical protein RQP46_001464 [Phenoliferia psychrophenolica]